MISITVVLDDSGLLKNCDVRGHAGAGTQGLDIVCAAVSVLTRTALATLSGREGLTVQGEASRRGVFTLKTQALNETGWAYLYAVGNFLIEGLKSVAKEYPQNCTMKITKERRS
ncbi:MAG: ribosomal-processing cysteine protease Prp [Spirochaetaceae bacterium]|nr:ribosomal-processing cysteine protease Prp [Spirochaetaceae bacterium]